MQEQEAGTARDMPAERPLDTGPGEEQPRGVRLLVADPDLASDLEGEAQIISWMSFIASTIHPARRIGVERWREVFGLAEKRLGVRDWAVGSYSIADIHLFRLYWRFVNSLHPAQNAFPCLSAHYDRMMARSAVQRVLEIESAIGYQLPQ